MGKSKSNLAIVLCIFAYVFSCFCISQDRNTLGVNDSLALNYGEYLESSNQRFRLALINTSSWTWFLVIQYVYMNYTMDVWTNDNYQTPIIKEPLHLTMSADGRLIVADSFHTLLLLVNEKQPVMINGTTATLLDNGDLVLTSPGGSTVWQSFDYPSNTWLQGMKIGVFDLNMMNLTSKGTFEESPSTLGVDPNNTKELIVMQAGVVYWRSGMWRGHNFDNLDYSDNFGVTFSYFSNSNDGYLTWNSSDPNAFAVLTITGNISIFSGDFSVNRSLAVCDEIDWSKGNDQSKGCTNPCGGGDGFNEILGELELDAWDNYTYGDGSLADCKSRCRSNCLCHAYSYITNSSGTWGCKTSLSRRGKYVSSDSQRIYIRDSFALLGGPNSTRSPVLAPAHFPAASPPHFDALAPGHSPAHSPGRTSKIPATIPARRKRSKKWKVMLSSGAMATFIGTLILLYFYCNKQSKPGNYKGLRRFKVNNRIEQALDKRDDDESPIFHLTTIEIATENFRDKNRLGQGGFGPVYKGKLQNGQEIAVKRLKVMSGHGIQQFKNEVTVITKLQHRNLVKLLGYCIHREERILVYEYMPNGSLDSFIFDQKKRTILDWTKRLQIIEGIAQGLLYLHKYSRLKIIHRDLKTSNILLDNDLNPKISDFGTARIFGDNESHANTKHVVGTYGYMSPEYALNGIISVKSDVFSFGVLMLEIISGKNNGSFSYADDHLSLIAYVWDLWAKGKVSDIVDPSLGEAISPDEIVRYAQVGLLCVQEKAADRPTMLDVVSMLNNETLTAPPIPNPPAFSAITSRVDNDSLNGNQEPCSVNKVTLSDLEGR